MGVPRLYKMQPSEEESVNGRGTIGVKRVPKIIVGVFSVCRVHCRRILNVVKAVLDTFAQLKNFPKEPRDGLSVELSRGVALVYLGDSLFELHEELRGFPWWLG